MDPENERKLWRNWMFLKQELNILDMLDKFVDAGIFTEEQKKAVLNVVPNSKLVRAEKFLKFVLESGDKGFDAFCNCLRENPNKYGEIIEKLELNATVKESSEPNLPQKEMSGLSVKNNSRNSSRSSTQLDMTQPSSRNNSTLQNETSQQASSAMAAVNAAFVSQSVQAAAAAMASDGQHNAIDMKTLETELINIAPTIADLFSRITQSTSQSHLKADELNKVKEENERLRKTNRTLIEKLNAFQHQIIQLQLENKKLRDSGVVETESKEDLEQKAAELEEMSVKLEEQREELEAKERELNEHLEKIKQIEDENESQKIQILKLELMHEEGVSERSKQQEQIHELREEKEKQKQKIELLEEMQMIDEERLIRLEERLRLLEQCAPVSHSSWNNGYKHKRRSNRVVSPPRSMPWMSGAVNRSHHANVKFQPPPPQGIRRSEKGWSF